MFENLFLKSKTTIFYCLVLLISTNIATAENLKIGIRPNYPPFSDLDAQGVMVGFDVDIAKALCDNLKANCTIVSIPPSDFIEALTDNRVDAIISSWNNTDERKEKVTFSNKYYHIPSKMVKSVNSNLAFTAKDLKGKKVGLRKDSVQDRHLTKTFSKIIEIKRYSSVPEAVKALEEGEVDFVEADSLVLELGFLNTPTGKNFKFFGPDLSDSAFYGTGAAIAVKLGNQLLADRFNLAIDSIRKSGKYRQLSYKYFQANIYGY